MSASRHESTTMYAEGKDGGITLRRTDESGADKKLDCVSCSCCCPLRHAVRDEGTGKISIKCGNPHRANLGTPSMHD